MITVVIGQTGSQTFKTHCESTSRAEEVRKEYMNKGYYVSSYTYIKRI